MNAPSFTYEKNPRKIYAESFRIIRAETDLTHLPASAHPLAIRIAHAAGDPAIVERLHLSGGAIEAGQQALARGAPLLCDGEMVAQGIITRALKARTRPHVSLNDPEVPKIVAALNTTRSAAAVELWGERIKGAVIVIGNAPTALFHLLERINEGWKRPALILGFPVGFVGAKESKEALAASDLPFITLLGRRGGSAIASAALNALSLGLEGDGT